MKRAVHSWIAFFYFFDLLTRYTPISMVMIDNTWANKIISPSIIPQKIATTGTIYVTEAPNTELAFFNNILNMIIEMAVPKTPKIQTNNKLCVAPGTVSNRYKKSVEKRYTPDRGPININAHTVAAIEFTLLR